jgi:hypothetical protein
MRNVEIGEDAVKQAESGRPASVARLDGEVVVIWRQHGSLRLRETRESLIIEMGSQDGPGVVPITPL